MANKSEEKISTISLKFPTSRYISGITAIKSGYKWLEGRRADDGAEGLWRIHNKLYDFNSFVKMHPGGAEWLSLTDGTDITELFETHHLSIKPSKLLKQYYVKDALEPRNILLTFEDDGFYKTLQGKVFKIVQNLDTKPAERSKIINDILVILAFTTAILAAKLSNFYVGTLAGIILAYATICSHNFFHQKDNFRMYYFNLSLLSFRDWRIMHAMSHHLYPNTYHDMEVSWPEPYLNYLPTEKTIFQKYISWIYAPLIFATICKSSLIFRLIMAVCTKRRVLHIDDLIPLSLPLCMALLSGNFDIKNVLLMWLFIITVCSCFFGFIGVNTGHHHPILTHDGDELKSLDFGIFQIDTIVEKSDIKGSQIMVLTHFGEHVLHHLFPTLDHGLLPQLNEVFLETCGQFDNTFRLYPWYKIMIGQYQQLARTKPLTQKSKIKSELNNCLLTKK